MKEKFKNYAFLSSFISGILMAIVQILSLFDIYLGTEIVSTIVSAILGFLVAIGVIAAPKKSIIFDEKNIKDTKKTDVEDDDAL